MIALRGFLEQGTEYDKKFRKTNFTQDSTEEFTAKCSDMNQHRYHLDFFETRTLVFCYLPMKPWLLTGILLFLFSCRPEGSIEIPKGRRIFATEDGRLFFRNVRSPYYDKSVNEVAQTDAWRLSARDTSNRVPHLNLCIYDAWARNEAYLVPEPNALLGKTFRIELSFPDGKSEVLEYSTCSPADATRFSLRLYEALSQGAKASLGKQDLFKADAAKDFKKVCEDYLKLINQ